VAEKRRIRLASGIPRDVRLIGAFEPTEYCQALTAGKRQTLHAVEYSVARLVAPIITLKPISGRTRD
jgi:hypothetical protein